MVARESRSRAKVVRDLGFERRVWLVLSRACAEPCGLVLLIMIGPLAISAATATSTPDSTLRPGDGGVGAD